MAYLVSIILQNLVLGTQILMVAMGLYLVYAASKIVHLALGATGVAAAYGLYWGITLGWPLWAAILFALGVAVFLGFLSSWVLEPFAVRQEALLGLIVSFALGMMIESVIAIFFGTDGKSLQTGILPTVPLGGGIELDLPGVVTICLGLFLAAAAWAAVQFTRTGRLLRSIAENSSLAASLGVNTRMVRRIAYVIAALVAAVVIGLSGWHTALTPLMGFQLIAMAFMALLMGGVQDLRGTIISAYLIAIVPGLIIGFVGDLSENWRLVFVFCIAAMVLAVRPNGIFTKGVREA